MWDKRSWKTGDATGRSLESLSLAAMVVLQTHLIENLKNTLSQPSWPIWSIFWGNAESRFWPILCRWGEVGAGRRNMLPGPDGRREREGSLHRDQRCAFHEYLSMEICPAMCTLVRAIESRIDVDGQDSTTNVGAAFQRRLLLLVYYTGFGWCKPSGKTSLFWSQQSTGDVQEICKSLNKFWVNLIIFNDYLQWLGSLRPTAAGP